MRSILFINRVYPPWSGATGQLLEDLARAWVAQGWQVTILTCGEGEFESSSVRHGVRVERVQGLPFTKASHLRRALSYLSFYPALLWRALHLPSHDVLITMTDPPLQCLLGPLIRKIKGGRLVHWAQDIYPELAEELGVLKRRGWTAKVLRWIANWALQRHDQIIAVGSCMRQRLIERGLPSARIATIPNWGHAEMDDDSVEKGHAFRRQFGLTNRFVVMYSGNLGLAHPMDAIFETAKKLNCNFPEIVFMMIGQGPKMSKLKDLADKAGLENMRFLPPRQRGQLMACLAAADVHLACMHSHLCGLVVPSKVYGVLAAQRPCIFMGPEGSEVARLISRHRCGAVLAPEDSKGLGDLLVHWFANREQWNAAWEAADDVSTRVMFESVWEAWRWIVQTLVEPGATKMPRDIPRLVFERKVQHGTVLGDEPVRGAMPHSR